MRVIVGADHGGFEMKEEIKRWIMDMGYEAVDAGNTTLDLVDDYVDFAQRAVGMMKSEDRVVLFCRNGMGMAIVANKYRGVRCGLGFGPEAVRRGRVDDDINGLAVPADYCTLSGVKEMVRIFLTEGYSRGEKYERRLQKIDKIEKSW